MCEFYVSVIFNNWFCFKQIAQWIVPRALPSLYYYVQRATSFKPPHGADLFGFGLSLGVIAMVYVWERRKVDIDEREKVVGPWLAVFLNLVCPSLKRLKSQQ